MPKPPSQAEIQERLAQAGLYENGKFDGEAAEQQPRLRRQHHIVASSAQLVNHAIDYEAEGNVPQAMLTMMYALYRQQEELHED